MTTTRPDHAFPTLMVKGLDGEEITLGAPRGTHDWQMVVVYRGQHCPLCKTYLKTLDGLVARYSDLGVDIVAVSADSEDQARGFVEETGVGLTVAYGLRLEQMQTLGLYVSDPRSEKETDHPFAEPGVFVINDKGDLHIVDISNAPFARPDLEALAKGIGFIRDKDYPVRGTKMAA